MKEKYEKFETDSNNEKDKIVNNRLHKNKNKSKKNIYKIYLFNINSINNDCYIIYNNKKNFKTKKK